MLRVALLGLGVAFGLAGVPDVSAHQTATNDGATVTLHVNPDDQPIAGQPAYVYVTKVRVGRRARFRWRKCACRLTVTSAGGELVGDLAVRGSAAIPFVFPQEGAYGMTLSGRYRRRHRWRPFSVTFGIRADAAG
jgi:hypothetical protein